MARIELPNGVILPAEFSDDWYEDMTSNLTKLDDVIGSDSEKLNADGVNFLRMSSAALTDGGTGNFSDLNSSYKIKTGDLILDSCRKLYQVVSVDATNETFTVGNSLFKVTAESDLAPVAESGDYDDLDNKPDLKPVATSGDYDDLTDLPTYGITRYCSSAITDNSSIAFSAISSTNKIKVGDFLLDINGKMYQISAVDTANETVSVTTPLTQLAVDSSVIHNTGDETKSGKLTLDNDLSVYNASSVYTPIFRGRSSVSVRDSTNTNGDNLRLGFYDKNNNAVSYIRQRKLSNGNTDISFVIYNTDSNNQPIEAVLNFVLDSSNDPRLSPGTDNTISLGRPTYKYRGIYTYKINDLDPSSLGMPVDRGLRIDISGSFTDTSSGGINRYTIPANGWVYLAVTDTVILQVFSQTSGSLTNYGDTKGRSAPGNIFAILPVRKNDVFVSQWYTTLTNVTVTSAYFIPCQGNV